MGKSLGNFITLPDLFKTYNPMVVRYFILQFHYRSAVDFSDDGLKLADKQFGKLRDNVNAIKGLTLDVADELNNPELKELFNGFMDAMNEDFNTPVAMVEFNKINKIITSIVKNNDVELAKEVNFIITNLGEKVLGLDFGEIVKVKQEGLIPAEVVEKAQLRWESKQNKDWAIADKFRDEILAMGYIILDSKDGYKLEKK
jgi:cysteinyl-tRNA synthetase